MLIILFLITSCGVGVFGGSICPPKNRLYPCRCINIEIGKRYHHTIISCRHLQDISTLETIYPPLMTMEIDKFVISDSFLKEKSSEKETKGVLPSDWFTLTWIKELEIMDSDLFSCFGCKAKLPCRNHFTTKLEIINSSSSSNICFFCNVPVGTEQNTGLSCLSQLKQFHFTRGKLSSINTSFFPQKLEKLMTLNLSYNEIQEMHPGVFNNLPSLIELDLSHNALGNMEGIFNRRTELEFLDLSWNSIRSLSPDFFIHLWNLKTFNIKYNLITTLVQWKTIPKDLMKVNFSGNMIHCDCKIRWLNSSLSESVDFTGNCASPEGYKNSFLRNASYLLATRCDALRRMNSRRRTLKKHKHEEIQSVLRHDKSYA